MSQPVPPAWKDLGKASADLLNKDFPINGTQLEVKTSSFPTTFKVAGTRDGKSGAIAGDIEGKFADKKNGITITQNWSTANVLKTQVELENQIAKGLKIDVVGSLQPVKSTKSVIVTTAYKQPSLNAKAVIDLFKGPTVTADTVIGRDGFLLGAEATYDVTSGSISRYAAALGYAATDYSVALHALGNGSSFAASYFHKVNVDTEAGAKAVYDTKSTTGGVSLEVGAKTYLDNACFIKTKINSSGVLALGYTQALRKGVKVSFGAAIDTQSLSSTAAATGPAHKIGASFTFES